MSLYPKGDQFTTYRSSRSRKRSFHGNQFSKNVEKSEGKGESASAKKLQSPTIENTIVNPLMCYRFIKFFTVFIALSDILICRSCMKNVKFEETGIKRLGFKIVVRCRCESRQINSSPLINIGFEINWRIVFVIRLLGIGRQGLNLFCRYIDIDTGIAEETYNRIYDHIYSASKKIFEYCCQKTVKEEKKENEKLERSILNSKVSGDGTWKKEDSNRYTV